MQNATPAGRGGQPTPAKRSAPSPVVVFPVVVGSSVSDYATSWGVEYLPTMALLGPDGTWVNMDAAHDCAGLLADVEAAAAAAGL